MNQSDNIPLYTYQRIAYPKFTIHKLEYFSRRVRIAFMRCDKTISKIRIRLTCIFVGFSLFNNHVLR